MNNPIVGVNGLGNQFADRFAPGGVISAGQLNDALSGISTGLVIPYVGQGANIAYGSGGTQIVVNDDPREDGRPFQFEVRVLKDGNKWKVQVANGFCVYRDGSAGYTPGGYATSLTQCLVKGVAIFPTGKKTIGENTRSPWADKNGNVEIARGA
jgi:hypothetical protein